MLIRVIPDREMALIANLREVIPGRLAEPAMVKTGAYRHHLCSAWAYECPGGAPRRCSE